MRGHIGIAAAHALHSRLEEVESPRILQHEYLMERLGFQPELVMAHRLEHGHGNEIFCMRDPPNFGSIPRAQVKRPARVRTGPSTAFPMTWPLEAGDVVGVRELGGGWDSSSATIR